MDLSLRLMILSIVTIIFTLLALLVFLAKNRFRWFHHFHEAFLALFGIQPEHPTELRYLVSWLLTTCLATLNYALIINIVDATFLLSGLSGIPLDPWIISFAFGGIIASILLGFITLLSSLPMPASWSTALGIIGFLHLYSVHSAETLLGQVSAFLYFAATAIGFVAVFLALYLFLRHYIGAAILDRVKRDSNTNLAEADTPQ
ncbi:MAG: hypothetical protein Q6361_03410 [Candidatus Hermodarchaeota archaeon]|nr:hypothetical protein [Candidatus Hermodarchaeota archaeon]